METLEKIKSFQTYGNKKLLDCKVGRRVYKYAQFNTRPIKDCPFATEGCKIACYATSGCHRFPSVKRQREQSYEEFEKLKEIALLTFQQAYDKEDIEVEEIEDEANIMVSSYDDYWEGYIQETEVKH